MLFEAPRSLSTVEEWLDVVGDGKWKVGSSAWACATAWVRADGVPPVTLNVIRKHEVFRGFQAKRCCIERPTYLDTRRAPSTTDVLVYGELVGEAPVVIAVEAKADERFGDTIRKWARDGGERPTPSRLARLNWLNELLGTELSPDSEARYQLAHRFAAAILEARNLGTAAAMMCVQSFNDAAQSRSDPNWADYAHFCDAAGFGAPIRNEVTLAMKLGGQTPLFTAWVDEPMPAV